MASSNVTIIVLVHNNQHYLHRVISYYAKFDAVSLVIADSSQTAFFNQDIISKKDTYFHTQEKSLTNKIFQALQITHTAFVVLLGVDDFVIAESVMVCVDFLVSNRDYEAAIGKDIFFQQMLGEVVYHPVYEINIPAIETNNALERLKTYFAMYRTIYSAVQHTETLYRIFAQACDKITHLYLNEFLACIYPVYKGKIKYFDTVYTVREYNQQSLGFTSVSLHQIIQKESSAFNQFIDINATVIAQQIPAEDYQYIRRHLHEVLQDFSIKLLSWSAPQKQSITKKIGTFITYIPFIGKKMVAYRRYLHLKSKTHLIMQNTNDKKNISAVEQSIINA